MTFLRKFLIIIVLFHLQLPINSWAQEQKINHLGNANAPTKGVLYYNLMVAPTTLNPLTSTDGYSGTVQGYVQEGLLSLNTDTHEWEPSLATSWSISRNGLVFEFKLRQGVKWHDGTPLTIEDVKFSYDAIYNPKYKTAHLRPYLEKIKSAEIVDKNTIRFVAKEKYFKNFDVVAGGIITIIPKHIYEDPSKKELKKLNKTLIGTGPYILDRYDRGKKLILKKNPNWWGNKIPALKGIYNYKKIIMKFVKGSTISIEMLKKGNFDFLNLNAEEYMKKAIGKEWGKSVFKVKTQNKAVKGYSFIGWNLLDPLFKSRKVRLALYHLVNRQLMIEKFLYNMSIPATGPLYRQSPYASPKVRPVTFDPKRAWKLLKEEGWSDSDNDQILDKMIDGKKQKLSFTILEPNKEFVKYLTIFKEDAKKKGVEVKIKLVEWNTFVKLLHEKNFQAVRLTWGGGSIKWDPKQVWHSASAKGGSNFISYKNEQVDQLIDEARTIMDDDKRMKKLHKVFELIAHDVPYVFFFNQKNTLYAHTKRIKREKVTYKYGVGLSYWWIEK